MQRSLILSSFNPIAIRIICNTKTRFLWIFIYDQQIFEIKALASCCEFHDRWNFCCFHLTKTNFFFFTLLNDIFIQFWSLWTNFEDSFVFLIYEWIEKKNTNGVIKSANNIIQNLTTFFSISHSSMLDTQLITWFYSFIPEFWMLTFSVMFECLNICLSLYTLNCFEAYFFFYELNIYILTK